MESITDFAKYLQSFFTDCLAGERGVSRHTVRSYRDVFILLVDYMKDEKNIPADKLKMEDLTREVILSFLNWLQDKRGCGISTRNQRFAAIRAFFGYLQYKDPARMSQWQSVRSIRLKRSAKSSVSYLTFDGIKCLLEQIPAETRSGRRDLALLSLLYDSGARVQELIDLTPSALRLYKPYIVELSGKCMKKRIVPLQEKQTDLLRAYIKEFGLDQPSMNKHPLFFNSWGEKLTGAGVTYILLKYARTAKMVKPELIPDKISPHVLRHSKAMHLLQAGVNLVYIRDILGHVSIQTTEVYARADSKLKREALQNAYTNVINKEPSWEKDPKLRTFLKNLA